MSVAVVLLASSTVSAFMAPIALRSRQSAGPVAALGSRTTVQNFHVGSTRQHLREGWMKTVAMSATTRQGKEEMTDLRDVM